MSTSFFTIFRRGLVAALLAFGALAAQAAADANQATRAELETVKGIGPGLSAKIIEARKTGAFKNWADLVERVGGIGPGNAAKFSQAGLTVAGAPYDGKAAAEGAAKTGKSEKAGAKPAAKKPDA
ncbi:conserved exported hypothetical protein [Rubrivivax sp. A210]|uniref:ComEA family DNA-binding protein n=1 Tax=Rubrivivax sp. A210 TaxID=2772301 RepID=UPI001919A4C8|nr:helix-hairpin-helix domain-containing protein [Rubrivivax sp. A210]CAD5373651.1 conserved exported hypothetical protein [Rubrivivax sp. A210]